MLIIHWIIRWKLVNFEKIFRFRGQSLSKGFLFCLTQALTNKKWGYTCFDFPLGVLVPHNGSWILAEDLRSHCSIQVDLIVLGETFNIFNKSFPHCLRIFFWLRLHVIELSRIIDFCFYFKAPIRFYLRFQTFGRDWSCDNSLFAWETFGLGSKTEFWWNLLGDWFLEHL